MFECARCGHCKEFKDEYAEIGEAMGGLKNLVLAKVNADESRELTSRFGIEGGGRCRLYYNNP